MGPRVSDRQTYLDHYMVKHGARMLNEIRAKAYYSAPANYGAAYTSCWDNENKERSMELRLPRWKRFWKKRGMLYG